MEGVGGCRGGGAGETRAHLLLWALRAAGCDALAHLCEEVFPSTLRAGLLRAAFGERLILPKRE